MNTAAAIALTLLRYFHTHDPGERISKACACSSFRGALDDGVYCFGQEKNYRENACSLVAKNNGVGRLKSRFF
jgi:hypothetical protein